MKVFLQIFLQYIILFTDKFRFEFRKIRVWKRFVTFRIHLGRVRIQGRYMIIMRLNNYRRQNVVRFSKLFLNARSDKPNIFIR